MNMMGEAYRGKGIILKIASALSVLLLEQDLLPARNFTYFTSFGLLGIIGGYISTALFAYLGMVLTRLGSRMRTTSHKDVIYELVVVILELLSIILYFTLFGVGVVMIAGAGSNLNQQFGYAPFVGSMLMVVLVFITIMLNVEKVVGVIGSITPFLILAVVLLAAYCL